MLSPPRLTRRRLKTAGEAPQLRRRLSLLLSLPQRQLAARDLRQVWGPKRVRRWRWCACVCVCVVVVGWWGGGEGGARAPAMQGHGRRQAGRQRRRVSAADGH
jgi:hypothetical protein